MIMNICSCLQKTQIKLENVRAKNVQENTHTLQLLLSSTNVLEILRAQHSSGGEFTIVKARNPHAEGARLQQRSSTQNLSRRRRLPLKGWTFPRTPLCLGALISPRSTVQGLQPPQAKEARLWGEPAPQKWLSCLGVWKKIVASVK